MTVSCVIGSSALPRELLDAHTYNQTCRRFQRCVFPTVNSAVSCSLCLLDTSLLVAIFPASRYASLPISVPLTMGVNMRRKSWNQTFIKATQRRSATHIPKLKGQSPRVLYTHSCTVPVTTDSEQWSEKEPKKESD